MTSPHTTNRTTPEDDDLGQATVRELILQLASTEDEHRRTVNPGRIAILARREQAIVAALHRKEPALNAPGNQYAAGLEPILLSDVDLLVEK
jgi:cobalamin biosynthesis protein CbiG